MSAKSTFSPFVWGSESRSGVWLRPGGGRGGGAKSREDGPDRGPSRRDLRRTEGSLPRAPPSQFVGREIRTLERLKITRKSLQVRFVGELWGVKNDKINFGQLWNFFNKFSRRWPGVWISNGRAFLWTPGGRKTTSTTFCLENRAARSFFFSVQRYYQRAAKRRPRTVL